MFKKKVFIFLFGQIVITKKKHFWATEIWRVPARRATRDLEILWALENKQNKTLWLLD